MFLTNAIFLEIQWKLYITKGQKTGKIICSLLQGLAMSRFFSIYFTISGVKKIVCYTEDFAIIIEACYIEVPLYVRVALTKIL